MQAERNQLACLPSDMTVAPRGAPGEVWLEVEAALDEYIKDWVSHLIVSGHLNQQPPEPPSQTKQDREIRAAIDALVFDGEVEGTLASMAVSLASFHACHIPNGEVRPMTIAAISHAATQ